MAKIGQKEKTSSGGGSVHNTRRLALGRLQFGAFFYPHSLFLALYHARMGRAMFNASSHKASMTTQAPTSRKPQVQHRVIEYGWGTPHLTAKSDGERVSRRDIQEIETCYTLPPDCGRRLWSHRDGESRSVYNISWPERIIVVGRVSRC